MNRGLYGSGRAAGWLPGTVWSTAAPARQGERQPDVLDLFLRIRCHVTTIFAVAKVAKESGMVFELKRIVEGISKRSPEEQHLYENDQLLDDGKTLGKCGFTSQTARPQAPAR
ncbi:hypothetical protein P7K49_015958 [Saguinus oedipus]|uniref:Ubiquitin-like domain-containing protein n=1 Tax=Saguinus oedipus TaxID=9490 RepID=A0ABQ9VAQ0_SAGOE|nr:hypothetical protein P7K49_015958 [Saguinus oedipus]